MQDVTTGTYRMRNGRRAIVTSVKSNGQAIDEYECKKKSDPNEYWVWESNGKAKFIEPSGLDLMEKLT